MDQTHHAGGTIGLRRGCAAWLIVIAIVLLFSAASPTSADLALTPTPTIDRLATPVLPANPTTADLGRQVYYLNCMPCHGDVGQGLTDEWRAVWVEDHQNCWAKGCHGGRQQDEGFPLPQTIPAVIGLAANMTQHATFAELESYLHETHPPQRPGKLTQQEYEQVTAFLWHENQRDAIAAMPSVVVVLAVGALSIAAIIALLIWYRARRIRN